MAPRRRLAAMVLVAVAAMRTAPVAAQAVTDGGCATLADAVRLSVELFIAGSEKELASARRTRSSARVAAVYSPQTCGRTAAVASAAFTEAMARMNLPISWIDREPGPGDVCRSHHLMQCSPQPSPGLPMSAHDSALVADAWRRVRAGIRRQMPFGVASDISYFQPSARDRTLAIGLRTIVPRPAAYLAAPSRSGDPSAHRRTGSRACGGS